MDHGSSKPEPGGVRDSTRAIYSGHDGGPPTDSTSFSPRCLSIDLEVGREDARIHRFAAVRGDTGESFHFRGGDLNAGLAKLDRLADGAAFVVGHNLIDFDAKYLAASNPNLRLLHLPQVDTLRLNPLAFPRNPYHHLVKHYQDGQLKHGSRNDPELDARLTLGVFRDQHQAFRAMSESAPELVLAYHWLTTVDGNVLRVGCLLCDGASPAATVVGEGGRGDPASDERQGLPGAKPRRCWRTRPHRHGHWPTCWPGCPSPVATRSCRPGCGISFPRRVSWCASCGTLRAASRPARGVVSATTPDAS